jgi:beta-hydroxylase
MHIRIELKCILTALFLAAVLFVHFCGRVRHAFFRKQLTDHSGFFAPYNVLAYLFFAVPLRPYLERERFPQLAPLRANWHVLREEALQLFDRGYVCGGLRHEDAGFSSLFKRGWRRFHLKWYGQPLPSARTLCSADGRIAGWHPERESGNVCGTHAGRVAQSASRSVCRLATLSLGAGDAELGCMPHRR